MIPSINSISSALPLPSVANVGTESPSPNASGGFQSMMINALSEVGQLETSAQHSVQENLIGGDITQAEVFSDMKKLDLAIKLTVQLRNKIVDAFQEIQQLRM